MNPVRRLIGDLVEKKLWPVALLLIATAVALPLLIGGGGDAGSAAAEPSVAVPTAAAAVTPAVELVGPPAVRTRPGPVRDPFRRTKKKAKAAESASSPVSVATAKNTATTSASKGTSAKSGGSASGSSAAKRAAPKATTITAATRAAHSAYQTVVRFTRPGGARERPLYRLSVLGNTANPALQFLGVGDDGEYAIFLLGPKATASGDDGACVVTAGCRVIGLRKGDRLGVDVAVGSSSRHYVVEVTSMRRLQMSSTKAATAWRKRVDPIGREVLRTIREDDATAAALRRVAYATSTGTVGLTSAP